MVFLRRLIELGLIGLFLAAAVYAQDGAEGVWLDWVGVLREAGAAAAVVSYFLFRIERRLSEIARAIQRAQRRGGDPPAV
jgi:hypothetical protein